MKKVLIAVATLVVLGGAGAAAWFLWLAEDPPSADTAVAGAGAVEPEPAGEPIYLALAPEFVVNFEYQGGVRYLQVGLQVMAYEQAVLEKVAANMPAVRSNLILLLSDQDYPALNTVAGKEALRQAIVEAVNAQLKLTGRQRVREAFFTSFVVQ